MTYMERFGVDPSNGTIIDGEEADYLMEAGISNGFR